ncbi:MAG: response regulator transcription factor, partial [Limisphaerales bacterium]
MSDKKSKIGAKRILIVDDHPMMRQGLAQLIESEPDLDVCGEAGDANEALSLIKSLKPDVVLTDITLPGKNGLELLK